MRGTLGELIDFDKLNQSERTRVVLGAIDVATSKPKYFDNKAEGLEADHIVASGSIPTAFPMTAIGAEHYWDGGLFLNTPLSSAINCLEQLSGDIRRELIVVELFPMAAPLPRDMAQVTNRLWQLIFASKLKIDRKLFSTINSVIDFMRKIEPHIPAQLRHEAAYQELFASHKKIDALTAISAKFADDMANAGDFSQEAIDYRVNAGYDDAMRQKIGTPHPV